MIDTSITDTEADARIRELEFLAKGLENKARCLMTDISNPEVFARHQEERRKSIARWQAIVDNAEVEFAKGAELAAQWAARARQLRIDVTILKRRQKIEELLALGAQLGEVETILGESGVSMLHAMHDKSVRETISANAEA